MTDEEMIKEAGIDPSTGGDLEAQTEQATPQEEMYSFKHGEQEYSFPMNAELTVDDKRVPFNNLLNSYRQASHLNEKWATSKKEWEEKSKRLEELENSYKEFGVLQDWSKQNPEEWKLLQDIYNNRVQNLLEHRTGATSQYGQEGVQEGNAGNPNLKPLFEHIQKLENKLNEFSEFRSNYETERERYQAEQDTEEVKAEIQEFKDTYKHVNLDQKNEQGIPLSHQILTWGAERGYPSFASAAFDYLGKDFVSGLMNTAKQDQTKQIQKDKQQGIVAKSPTPFSSGQQGKEGSQNVRAKSYSELRDEALEEYKTLVSQEAG